MPIKACTKCGGDGPFTVNRAMSDGLNSKCVSCASKDWGNYYDRNGERVKARKAEWRKDHPDAAREKDRKSDLKRHYNMSPDQYDHMLSRQGGACANPGCRSTVPGGRGRFHVDHDHQTGLVRALLCHSCNVALGCLGDNPDRIDGFLRYLVEYGPPFIGGPDAVFKLKERGDVH